MKELKTKAELIAFIYDKKTKPSAIIRPHNIDYTPYCVHSLRLNELGFFDDMMSNAKDEKSFPWHAWERAREYPEQGHTCLCHLHRISGAVEHCTAEVIE